MIVKKILADVAKDDVCEIKDLGGTWRVISDNGKTVTVVNTISGQSMNLNKNTQLK